MRKHRFSGEGDEERSERTWECHMFKNSRWCSSKITVVIILYDLPNAYGIQWYSSTTIWLIWMFEPPSTKTFIIRIYIYVYMYIYICIYVYIYIQGIGDIIRQTPQVGMKDAPDKTVHHGGLLQQKFFDSMVRFSALKKRSHGSPGSCWSHFPCF